MFYITWARGRGPGEGCPRMSFPRLGRGNKRTKGILLHATNIRAKFCYADPVLGISPSEVARRRARAADHAGRAAGGRCTATIMLMHYLDDGARMSA
eukprot:2610668-Pyramimonas_sp.AAC.1